MTVLPEIFDIAYSNVGIAPINTETHYRMAAACGYPVLKGDIQPTADGGLVMCHDSGFTCDEAGRIGRFDREHNTPIRTLRFDDALRMQYLPYQADPVIQEHVASLDTFLRVCRETGKFAFITARDKEIPTVVAEMMRLIRLHGMEERCVINSFTYETLQEVRKYTADIPISHVQGRCAVLTDAVVDAAADLGNAVISMFSYPYLEDRTEEAIRASMPAVQRALGRDMRMFQAILTRQEDREACLKLGFTGFQLMRVFPPYAVPAR